MKRAILLVLDGLGIGDMLDSKIIIPKKANTLKSILSEYMDEQQIFVQLLNSEYKTDVMYFSGCSKLEYYGADSILGHKEIIGLAPDNKGVYIEDYEDALIEHFKKNYHIEKYNSYMCLDNNVLIANNIEGNIGVAINVLGDLSKHRFDELLNIGCAISNLTGILRVIVMGSDSINWNSIELAVKQRTEHHNSRTIKGIIISQTGAYRNGYKVQNITKPLSNKSNVINIFLKNNCPVTLIGKTADFFGNQSTKNFYGSDTTKIFQKLLYIMKEQKNGFIFANIQEIDLAGHSQNVKRGREILYIVNKFLPTIISNLKSNDLLIITADHGNDPLIGHPYHTREYVPLIIFNQNIVRKKIEICDTLSDIGTSILDYYGFELPENGTSFMDK